MTLEGYGPYQIANRLSQEKIEIPSLHLSHYGEGVNQSKTFKDPYGWGSSTIVNILKKREYLGHTINRASLLCRLRRQDVRPPHQQRQAYLTVYLLPI